MKSRGSQFYNTPTRRNLDWQNQAACLNVMDFLDDNRPDAWRKRFCQECPVINQCLEYALSMSNAELQHKGIMYGGHTGHDIALAKRRMRERAA